MSRHSSNVDGWLDHLGLPSLIVAPSTVSLVVARGEGARGHRSGDVGAAHGGEDTRAAWCRTGRRGGTRGRCLCVGTALRVEPVLTPE